MWPAGGRLMSGINETVGRRIRARRRELGMTVAELARRAGLAETRLMGIELGQERAGADLVEIAQALKVSLSYFFQDRDGGSPG